MTDSSSTRYPKNVPSKNRIKHYVESGFYHLYNRGVDKKEIFIEEKDYSVFLSYLEEYLSPLVPPTEEEIKRGGRLYIRKNYHQKIELLAFVLMPNHFHLLLKQNESRAIEGFMRSLLTRYSGYFNKNHDRVGHLLQDAYKGVLVEDEKQFIWLSRYIHRNPFDLLKKGAILSSFPYSSYPIYLGTNKPAWIKTDYILGGTKDYQDFVEGKQKEQPLIYPYILD